MGAAEDLNVGIVGTSGRGAELAVIFHDLEGVRVGAVCDIDEDASQALSQQVGGAATYSDYDEMLAHAGLDAVVVATPMPLHVPQAIAALQSGVHVLCEVPVGVSVEECRDLTVACRKSGRVFSMAENFCYFKPNILVRELVRAGMFGTVYHASADYWDEYKANNELTPWRRRWQTGINGVTYGTHSLGPLLWWLEGDRIASVSCVGSGRHHRDPRGDYYENEDCSVMLGRLASGGLIVLRHDMTSDRPRAPFVNALQGTDGCYESSRSLTGDLAEQNRVWLRSRCPTMNTWIDLSSLEDEFLPEVYLAREYLGREYLGRSYLEQERLAQERGYAFYAYFPVLDFVQSIVQEREPAIGIDQALDMTLPGLVSQRSISAGGEWIDVPDSRAW